MSEFKYIPIPNFPLWIVSAPKRSHRPHITSGRSCVFCPGRENEEPDVYRIPEDSKEENWQVRVIPNKFPFAPIHEVVILTPDHIKHWSDMSISQVRLGIEAYVNRYNAHKDKGVVCIFGNYGHDAGESVGHPHAQIAVIEKNVGMEVPKLEHELNYRGERLSVGEFDLICPPYSQWPDEVWIVPHERKNAFGDISLKEVESLSFIWQRLIKIFEIRHSFKFPHNFYIYPYEDWYIRILPRAKIAGGFEIATGIFVNTQDPHETMAFIKEHFAEAEEKKIKKSKAKYRKGV